MTGTLRGGGGGRWGLGKNEMLSDIGCLGGVASVLHVQSVFFY